MIWKVYFWILAILAISNTIQFIERRAGLIPVFISVIPALAVFAYSYKKKIFSPGVWRFWFVIVVLIHSFWWFVGIALKDFLTSVVVLSVGLLTFGPAWYCTYKLATDKRENIEKSTASKKSIKK